MVEIAAALGVNVDVHHAAHGLRLFIKHCNEEVFNQHSASATESICDWLLWPPCVKEGQSCGLK